jgi:hypothetical protein
MEAVAMVGRFGKALSATVLLLLAGCVTNEPKINVVARSAQEIRPVHLVYFSRPPLPTHWRVQNARTANTDDLVRRATESEAAFAGQAQSELKRHFEADGLFRSMAVEDVSRLDLSPANFLRYLAGRRAPRGEDVFYVYPGASSVACTQMGFGFLSCSTALQVHTVLFQGEPKRIAWASAQLVDVSATPESGREAWGVYWTALRERMKAEGVAFAGVPPGR